MRSKTASIPYGIWMAIFIVVPMILVVIFAFTDKSGRFTLENIAAVGQYSNVFLRSIWLGAIATGICLLVGYPLAYIISRTGARVQSVLVMLVMLPMWMNFLLRTYAWMTLLEDNGIINTALATLGLPKLHMINTSGAVVLGMVYNYIPYMILPLYSALAKMDHSVIEAAQDLGCPPVRAFFKVVLPEIMPGIVTGMIMAFTLSIDDFVISYFTSGTTQTLPIYIYSMTRKRISPEINALSTVLFACILVLLVIINVRQARDERKARRAEEKERAI